MEYMLTFSNGFGKVSSGEYLFDIERAPHLPFDFGAVYFETPTGLAFKIVDGKQIPLTQEEQQACCDYCDNYLENGDYPVQAYETDSGLYLGVMLKSEAQKNGHAFTLGDMPDHPACKRVDNTWQRVAVTIREDGSYVLMPESICASCVLFLTVSEWAEWPKPTRTTERWDFATETWQDTRTVAQAKKDADTWIRNLYVAKRKELVGNGPYQELASWPWQIEEAKAWIQDNEAETPFLDGVLEGLSSDHDMVMSKGVLVQEVLKYTDGEWLKSVGRVHGEMYVDIKKLRQCETLQEIDALTDALAVAKHAYPVSFALDFREEGGIVRSFRHN